MATSPMRSYCSATDSFWNPILLISFVFRWAWKHPALKVTHHSTVVGPGACDMTDTVLLEFISNLLGSLQPAT